MLNAMLDKRFPKRVAFPGDLSARVQERHDAFFEEVAFLFEIALCRGLQEEPTQSVRNAFSVLMDSDTVHNVHGGHEPWQDWYSVHFGDDWIAQLFDQAHADSVNPSRDPDITAMFFRANALLERIQAIGLASEEPVSLSIMEIMPEEIRLSLQGETVVQKQEPPAHSRPWLLVSENYVVHRYRLADKLGLSVKALSNYERGKRPKDITVWPKPLNPDNRHGKKFYDPLHVLDALSALPKKFGKNITVDDIIAQLMNGDLSSKLLPSSQKEPRGRRMKNLSSRKKRR